MSVAPYDTYHLDGITGESRRHASMNLLGEHQLGLAGFTVIWACGSAVAATPA